MRTKELSAETGLKERTIRFYEEAGLLTPNMVRRNGRNFREYTQEDVQRLKTTAALRRAGFTLEEIRTLLNGTADAETVFPAYLHRLRQEADRSRRLLQAAEAVCPAGMNPHTLAESLTRSAKYLELPPADLEPHFGRLDPETPEEKRRAIAAYQSRQRGRRPSAQTVAILLLSALCLGLALGCFGLFRLCQVPGAEPAPSGSTEGWLYYTELENGYYWLRRFQEDTGTVETVYSSIERLALVSSAEKVYVNDGGSVYSMNADGSGLYLLARNAAAAGGSRMAVYDGMLYLVDTTTDLLAGGSALARIPLSGGELESLDVYTGQDFSIYEGMLCADFFGDVTVLDLDTGETLEMTMDGYTGECAMGDGYIFQIHADKAMAAEHSLTWVRLEADGGFTVSESIDLPDHTLSGSFYAHGSRLYYIVVGVDAPNRLYAYDAEIEETVLISEVQSYSASPNVFFGEKGLYVPCAAESCYIPYAPE